MIVSCYAATIIIALLAPKSIFEYAALTVVVQSEFSIITISKYSYKAMYVVCQMQCGHRYRVPNETKSHMHVILYLFRACNILFTYRTFNMYVYRTSCLFV